VAAWRFWWWVGGVGGGEGAVGGFGVAGVRVLDEPRWERLSAVSPHTLRRTYGSDLLNRGVRIEVVSALLGHADSRTTARAYAQLLEATIAKGYLRSIY
jgi:integrase